MRYNNTRVANKSVALFSLILSLLAADEVNSQDLLPIGKHYAPPDLLFPPESADHPGGMDQAEAVDVNGDGRTDAVFSGGSDGPEGASQVHILLANEAGTMDLLTDELVQGDIPTTDRGFRQIIPADFNGDGRLDLFLESHGAEPDCGDGSVECWTGGLNQLLLSNEQDELVNVTGSNMPDFSDFTHGASILDSNGDGHLDIWVNNLGGSPLYNPEFSYLLKNDGQGHFAVSADASMPWQTPIVGRNGILPEGDLGGFWSFAVDADADGDHDLALGSTIERGTSIVLMQEEGGVFTFPEGESFPSPDGYHGSFIQHSLVHDLNNDGLDDVLLHQSLPDFSAPVLQILISNGDGTFRDETATRYPSVPVDALSDFMLHDLDNDGYLDLFRNVDGRNEIRINDGEGNFRPLANDWLTDWLGWNWIVLDVDGDGGTDFLADEWYGIALHKMNMPYGSELDGTAMDDRLIGGAHDNVYRGLDGNDVLDGGLGDDELNGGPGDDQLIGSKGDDRLIPGLGADTVDGGPGRDTAEYPFALNQAEVLPGKISFISNSDESVTDQLENTEYALFSDAATPLPTAEQSAITSLNGIAGLWYDPSLDGEGFNIITTPTGTVLFFYGYTAGGQRLWLISETLDEDFDFEQVLDLAMYEAQGGTFDQPAPSADALSEWGRLKALFDACGTSRLALHGEDGIKTTYQIKLAGIADADCSRQNLAVPSGLAGLWYDESLDGEGYNVIITNDSTVFFFYGYDMNGQRLWLISETLPGVPEVTESATLAMYAASGGTFDAPKPSAEALADWGELKLTFNSCSEATAILTGVDGEKTSSLVKLAGITDSSCPE